jgi:hypothetical protein
MKRARDAFFNACGTVRSTWVDLKGKAKVTGVRFLRRDPRADGRGPERDRASLRARLQRYVQPGVRRDFHHAVHRLREPELRLGRLRLRIGRLRDVPPPGGTEEYPDTHWTTMSLRRRAVRDFVFLLILIGASVSVCYVQAKKKRRNTVLAIVLGLFLNVWAAIVYLVIPALPDSSVAPPDPEFQGYRSVRSGSIGAVVALLSSLAAWGLASSLTGGEGDLGPGLTMLGVFVGALVAVSYLGVAAEREITALLDQAAPANLLSICGVGPLVAAKILGEVRDVGRFSSASAFAAYSGTAPIPASSGTVIRHRLHRGGNRQLNRAPHTVALTQARRDDRVPRGQVADEVLGRPVAPADRGRTDEVIAPSRSTSSRTCSCSSSRMRRACGCDGVVVVGVLLRPWSAEERSLRAEADGLEVQHGRGHGGAKADDQRPGERQAAERPSLDRDPAARRCELRELFRQAPLVAHHHRPKLVGDRDPAGGRERLGDVLRRESAQRSLVHAGRVGSQGQHHHHVREVHRLSPGRRTQLAEERVDQVYAALANEHVCRLDVAVRDARVPQSPHHVDRSRHDRLVDRGREDLFRILDAPSARRRTPRTGLLRGVDRRPEAKKAVFGLGQILWAHFGFER